MNCPKCGDESGVINGAFNHKQNERYRQRKCKSCGHVFYTTEFEVEYTQSFAYDFWYVYHRGQKRKEELRRQKKEAAK